MRKLKEMGVNGNMFDVKDVAEVFSDARKLLFGDGGVTVETVDGENLVIQDPRFYNDNVFDEIQNSKGGTTKIYGYRALKKPEYKNYKIFKRR